METEKDHKNWYDAINKILKCRPQNFPTAIDSTNPWKNYMQVKEDRHEVKHKGGWDISKKELISTVDFSARIPNISQNILLILEVAFGMSNIYNWKKRDNCDY